MNAIETRIVKRLIDAALARGYAVSVFDGEEWPVKRSADRTAILDAIGATDETTLRFRDAGAYVGSIFLVHGNEEDVISDASDNDAMEALISAAQ